MNEIKIYAFADEASPNIDEQITALKRNGLDGLEIRNVDGVNVSDITLEKAKEVKTKLDANGLITWSIGSPIGKIDIEKDDFKAHLEKLKHTLEIADILESKNIRMFSFYMPEGKDVLDYKNEVIDRLGQMCEIAKTHNVFLCHENEKGIYGDIPERCLEIHRALPELKGIFDPANYVQSGADTLKAWELLKDYIYYMHIKDSKTNGTVVPAGMGDGNVEKVVKNFIEKGGNSFTIEPHLTVFEGFFHLERRGETSVITEYGYPDSNTAFDAACNAFKGLL
ncbi:MAG: TIM barrel protein [Acutalibacteraceae bacterium]|jgi:sugar phosphate isomerase/epimerase|nr:TIM barrel protein [Acutalibacteraceae bacterium]